MSLMTTDSAEVLELKIYTHIKISNLDFMSIMILFRPNALRCRTYTYIKNNHQRLSRWWKNQQRSTKQISIVIPTSFFCSAILILQIQ